MVKWTIETFVIFDTESTGLPSPGNNPKITELCLLALNREELRSKQELRVLNKLQLCLNPLKPIQHRSSEITGLYNDALCNQATFREQANLIVSFLQSLKAPVCLLAHYGHGFDFRLLKAELIKSKQALSTDTLCADTLEAFRSFDGLPPTPEFVVKREREKQVQENIKYNRSTVQDPEKCCRTIPSQVKDDTKVSMSITDDDTESNITGVKRSCNYASEPHERDVKKQHFGSLQDIFEMTPEKRTYDFHPIENTKKSQDKDIPEAKDVRKQLFTSHNSNEDNTESKDRNRLSEVPEIKKPQGREVINTVSPSTSYANGNKKASSGSPKKSYALGHLYSFYFGQQPEEAHMAEDDCKTLLKIIRMNIEKVISYCDNNAVLFSEVSPLY